ncbi:3-isopropylmalate dehydratase [bacterium]|nr:3-isopropylmalate dehydratase [bacterium]
MGKHKTDKPLILKGRIRVVPVANVDTDMIFHNRHLHITEPEEMAPHIFGNLQGWENFPKEAEKGDILIVGHNFGCGSSRQQAVDGFIALGVAAIIGVSFGAIYKRNTINAGLPLIECTDILGSGIQDLDEIELNLETGTIKGIDSKILINGRPFTDVQKDIYYAGGLLNLVGD